MESWVKNSYRDIREALRSVDFQSVPTQTYVGVGCGLLVCKVVYGAFFSGYPVRRGNPHGKKKKVIVIGAGVSGIVAAKEMMDEGHEVVIYEKNQNYAGLWAFSATDRSSARVYNKLITNSSAMVMAFSDHPPPKQSFDDETREYHHDQPFHYTASQWKRYLDSYIDKYGIREKWKLGHGVQAMTALPNDRWKVTIRNEETQTNFDEECDFVCICTGQHHSPKDLVASIPGMSEFKGIKVHSSHFANAEDFKGKTVVVVGGGDSGGDIVKYVAEVSPGNVYHALRNGAHIVPRYFMSKDTPFDYAMTRFGMYSPFHRWLETRDRLYSTLIRKKAAEGDLVFQQIVKMLDINGLPERAYFGTKTEMGCQALADGSAALRTELKEMKGNTAIFHENTNKRVHIDSTPVENVDAVLFATGFIPRWDFLPTTALQRHPHLQRYSLVWHPDLKNVAFIGFARPSGLGAIPPLAEAHARWAAQVVSGKIALPSPEHMKKCNAQALVNFKKERMGINPDGPGHLIVFSHYLAHVYSKIGCAPPMGKLFFTNNKLFWQLMFKPYTPAQFRLVGPHAAPEVSKRTIDSLTDRELGLVNNQWKKVAFVNMIFALAAQLGFDCGPGYADAYKVWS